MKQEENHEVISDPGENPQEGQQNRQEPELTRKERRWVALGALKSALLISMVYLVGLGIAILLMTLL